jgi:hypothetical protein
MATALLQGNSGGPLPAHTGGFKENTCSQCHTTFPLNAGRVLGGSFFIAGVPPNYTAGTSYKLTIVLGHPGQSRWGFEFTARYRQSGRQAGMLVPADNLTQVKEYQGIQFISHTEAGTRKGNANGPVEFRFEWIAPDPAGGEILFNASANAANGDDDPMGDYIYTASAFTTTSGELTMAPATDVSPESDGSHRLNVGDRLLNLPVPVNLNRDDFTIQIQHRFIQSLEDSDAGDLFGVDSGANINLQMQYAVTDRLSAGLARARFDQVISFMGVYEFQTGDESFWKLSGVAGVEGQRNFQRQYSPHLQLAAALDFNRLRFHVVPTMVFNSRDEDLVAAFRRFAVNPESDYTFSLGLGADVALTPRLSVYAEYVPRLAGFGGIIKKNPAIGGGINIRTWGHVFNILVSSSRDFTPAKYAVNPGDNNVSLGFNIFRIVRH